MDADEESFVARVERAARAGDGASLVELLSERDSVYAGRGASRVERMRAYVLAKLVEAGVPNDAIPFVREEVELGVEPYGVAAAARVIATQPGLARELLPELERARSRIASRNDHVALDRYGSPGEIGDPTALELIDAAITVGRSSRSCCGKIAPPARTAVPAPARVPLGLDGIVAEGPTHPRFALADHVRGRPTLLGFFYTRCDNPNKCSVTMQRLGMIARRLAADGSDTVVLAITYDPSFDTPTRLEAYASARGFELRDSHRVVRVVEGFERLESQLALGVGFVGSLPNRHRIDAYALDHHGRVALTYARAELDPDAVVADLVVLAGEPVIDSDAHRS